MHAENTDRPQLMGVLNVTPDSFSDTGNFQSHQSAIAHGTALFEDGADIVDIGGEASGPGSVPCSAERELERVLPVVQALVSCGVVSVDTTKSSVARAVLQAGATIINDISGLRHDAEMAGVVRDAGAAVVIMFSKENSQYPLITDGDAEYRDVMLHITEFLSRQIDQALSAGIAQEKIILDPGMGRFVSHNPVYSWEILARLAELRRSFAGFRLLLGVSRKGFLGGALTERDPISQLIGVQAAERGVDILRTHNVRMAVGFHRALSTIAVK